jgi:FkbH-like protein
VTVSTAPALDWLPVEPDWRQKLRTFRTDGTLDDAVGLANWRLDFVAANALDTAVSARMGSAPPAGLSTRPVRLAILGSSTLAHLHASIRIGALRRGIWVETYENNYGQYLQELSDICSPLYEFAPTTILFAFDTAHITAGVDAAQTPADADALLGNACERIRSCWRQARDAFRCPLLQQTLLPNAIPLLGSNEHKLPSSAARLIERLNCWLRDAAAQEGVHLLALDARASRDGLSAWYDPALWHRSKQEVSPVAAPVYGDLVGRLLAALQGRSYKCLVLDLDNTLWGGVIGDDGLDGIVLGQGSPLGEAFLSVQRYARDLANRGVILAVCSKNDEANAWEPFDKNPEMVLRRGDISAFVANWNDKAANIREIAETLNIGLDSMVFLDDNPFERTLVRRELPAVAVPEVGEEPSRFTQILSDAGYFEAVNITDEDRERTSLYQSNAAREASRKSATDLPNYLRSLDMKLHWSQFDRIGLQRIVQLINKTNQFNLTTRRYSEEDVLSLMASDRAFGLQLRLIDRFGDNGIISIIIGKMNGGDDLLIDTWLMSCRVLGRQVEPTTLNLVAAKAQALGARRLIGEYRPTRKNGMVREHYTRLGFRPLDIAEDGSSRASLELATFTPAETFIDVREVQ